MMEIPGLRDFLFRFLRNSIVLRNFVEYKLRNNGFETYIKRR